MNKNRKNQNIQDWKKENIKFKLMILKNPSMIDYLILYFLNFIFLTKLISLQS